jgi:hypothetical protein
MGTGIRCKPEPPRFPGEGPTGSPVEMRGPPGAVLDRRAAAVGRRVARESAGRRKGGEALHDRQDDAVTAGAIEAEHVL